MFAHQLGDIEVVSRPLARHLRGEWQSLAPQHPAHAAEFRRARQCVHLQKLRNVRLENLQRGHLHGACAHCFEGHTERGGVGQDHAIAHEAHLRLGVGELQLEGGGARESVARAAADLGFQRDRHLADHVLVHVQRELVVLDAGGEFARGQAHKSLEVLARVNRVGELELDLALVVDLYRVGLCHREFIQRGNPRYTFTLDRQPERGAIPTQRDVLFLLPARDVGDGEPVLALPAQPLDGDRFAVQLGGEDLFQLLALFAVGRVDGAAQRHEFFVAVLHVQPVVLHGEVHFQRLHRELEGFGFRRHARQALGQNLHAVLGVRREFGLGPDDDFAPAGEGDACLHGRFDDDVGRGVPAYLVLGNHVIGEQHADRRVARDGAVAVLADGTHPARIRGARFGARRILVAAAAGGQGDGSEQDERGSETANHGSSRRRWRRMNS